MSAGVQKVVAGCLAGLLLCGAAGAIPASSMVSGGILAPQTAQAKTSGSIVRNGMFTISAEDFAKNMSKNYGRLSGCDLKAVSGLASDGVTMTLVIKDGSKEVAEGAYYDTSGDAIPLYRAGADGSFCNVTVFFDEYSSKRSGYIADTMKAVILTADPTLSAAQVKSLALEWIDSMTYVSSSQSIGKVTKNGITYTLASWDNESVWAVDIEVG